MSTQKKVQVVFEAVLKNFTSNVKDAAKTTLEIGEAGKKASKEVDFKEPVKSSDKLKGSVKETAKELLGISDKGKKASKDIDFEKPMKTSDKFKHSLKGSIKNLLGVSKEGRNASKSTNFGESTNSANKLNSTLERTMGTMKKMASLYVAKKVVGFTAGLVKSNLETFQDLEGGMRQVYTLLPEMSEVAFGKMTDDLKQFSIDMKTLPGEAIPALYSAISAGVSEDTVFGFLEESKKAAIGGGAELETAVDVLSSVVNAYGEEVLDVKEASDLMFVSIRNGKTSLNELASNLYSVVPIAESANVPFSNLTAAIADMTAKGTPTAQATTQIARSVEELSKSGTKASDIFNEMTGKTFRDFMAEGNNLQDAYKVMEQGADHLNISVNDLFGSVEAGNAVLALTGKGSESFANNLRDMEGAAGSTEAAYEKMNNTLKASIDGVRARMQVFAWDIAGQYVPEVKQAVDGLNSTFDNLSADGTLSRLGQSIGGIVAAIINQINNILSHADTIIHVIDTIAYHIERSMGTIISVIKNVVMAFLGFKVISGVASVIMTLVNVFQILGGVLPYIIAGAKALWAVLAANPIILVIGLVLALIMYLYNLSQEFATLGEFGTFILENLKLAFYMFGQVVWEVIAFILDKINVLLGWIPLIGDATASMSAFAQNALAGFDNAIATTGANINALRAEASKGIHIPVSIGTGAEASNPGKYENVLNNRNNGNHKASRNNQRSGGTSIAGIQNAMKNLKMPSYSGGGSGGGGSYKAPKVGGGGSGYKAPKGMGGGGSSVAPRKITISDKITTTKDKRQTKIDMYDSRASLAEAREDRKTQKQNLNHMLYEMKQQAKDLLTLQNKSTGTDKQKVEIERNKLLSQIAETTEEIRKSYIEENINKIKDGFQTAIDSHTSRAEVAEVDDDRKGYREHLNNALWEMKEQAKDLLGLQEKSKGKDKQIVEIARNKLLVEIAKVTEDIRDGIGTMIGEFNIPSELRKFTEYQYKVQTSKDKLSKQLVVSPNIRMYLTIDDTEGKGINQIQQEIKGFTNAIFQKDDLVSMFTRDVTRN